METNIMNAETAAKYLDMSKGLLYKLTSQHRIPFCKPCGKRIMFRKSDLDKWLDAGRVLTNQELQEKGGAQ